EQQLRLVWSSCSYEERACYRDEHPEHTSWNSRHEARTTHTQQRRIASDRGSLSCREHCPAGIGHAACAPSLWLTAIAQRHRSFLIRLMLQFVTSTTHWCLPSRWIHPGNNIAC